MSEPETYTPPQAASPEHEIVSARTLPFPRDRVFAAWTHPDLLAQWWGPAGFTNTFYNFDPRAGGRWRFTMHGPDGANYENDSVFDNIVPGERIVFRHLSAPQFTVVATFGDAGEGTRVEFRMIFADTKTCAAVKTYAAGKNEENFDRLEGVLHSLPAGAPEFRELKLIREIDATPAAIWRTWTTRTNEWWCPKPWTTPVVEWDLRSGGRSRTVMRGPDGEEMDMEGLFLEVVPERRVVFTDAILPGWVPTAEPFMIGVMEFEAVDGGTRYTASARHWSQTAHDQHVTMGFHPGWGAVADQLIALVAEDSK